MTLAQRLLHAQQLHQAGRLVEAETLYRAVLAEAPRQSHALHLLGVLAHQQGRHDEARRLIEQALAVQGPHPVFHSNLAAVYLALNRLDEAEHHCRTALRLQPPLADAQKNLAAILERRGQAPTELEREVAEQPADADAQHALGIALLTHGQAERAVEHLEAAVRLRPDFALAHSNLAAALSRLGRYEPAVASCREALRLDPNNTAARTNLSAILTFLGRGPAAVTELEEVLRRRPDHAPAIAMLAEQAGGGDAYFTDDRIRALAQRAGRADLPLEERTQLHFALALWLDRTGACDAAFEHARQGNELRRQLERSHGTAFDPAVHAAYLDRLLATFTPAYFERVRGFGLPTEVPVFIVGMMRSGTTLAEQILASHPQVHGAGERTELGLLASDLPRRLGIETPYPECVAQLDAATTATVAAEVLQALQADSGGAARVVDKMPLNFLGLGLIATLFPQARIIHCRRDALDTCLSCYFRNFATSFTFTYDLADLGFYYRQYERLMAHWQAVLPLPVFELPYEELTAAPEPWTRRLVEFCGLPWDDRCLRPHETERPVRTASLLQVRRPIYQSAVGRWQRYEKHLGPLQAALSGAGVDDVGRGA